MICIFPLMDTATRNLQNKIENIKIESMGMK